MPDALRKTISATESPALFNASPYTTRFMLYRRFKYGEEIPRAADNRMRWGSRMEKLVLEQAAEDLKLMIEPNRDADGQQSYVRNGLLGCTRDATIYSPDRGPGACETKCVFDYGVWMERWGGGDTIPREIEIQLQQQMLVGDGNESFRWGSIPVWVCGEMKYYEREPIPELWQSLRDEAARFMDEIANENEPDPFGSGIESPLLQKVFPTRVGEVLDLSAPANEAERENALRWAEQVRMMDWHGKERLGHEKGEKAIKAQLLALAKGNAEIKLPGGIKVAIKQTSRNGYTVEPTTFQTVKAYVPETAEEEEHGF